MSEYQYYEFQAIDRPLDEKDIKALRALSTRARITSSSFTNSYDWGDFSGDPRTLMERWFDLHFYWANWGTRRFMIRLPKRLVDRRFIGGVLASVDCATIRLSGENLILDMVREEVEFDYGEDEGGPGSLAMLAPLRTAVLEGDLRLFYLLWLTAVEEDAVDPETPEPMPGLGPLTPALEAFAEFFDIDFDLVEAAAERAADALLETSPPVAVEKVVSTLPDREKTVLLTRLIGGDPHVTAELRAEIRGRLKSGKDIAPPVLRTAGDLRARVQEKRLAREQAKAKKAEAQRKRKAALAEKERRERLDRLAQRPPEKVWSEIETEIERRNPGGYDRAASLLFDCHVLAQEGGTMHDFMDRLRSIRQRHTRKERFLERLVGLG